MPIERPRELKARRQGEMPVGACSCGAVYACDETGHNLGTAMIEALVFACNMDWDLAWGLLPEEDYLQEIVKHYDYVDHLVVPGGFFEKRRISGALFFIRLHEDVQEVTSDGVQRNLLATKPGPPRSRPAKKGSSSLSREEIETLVGEFRIEPIMSVAGEDRKLIRNLQRLLYSGDHQFRQRAAEVLGKVSAVIAETDPGTVSKLLQRLFSSITDTAAFTWGAFEAIGEIIRYESERFAGYIPHLYPYLADDTRRAQSLRAMGRIAGARPDLLRKMTIHFIPFLADRDPLVRGYAALLMGNLGAQEAKEDLENLRDDVHRIDMYEDGVLESKTVGRVASEALARL